MAGETRPYCGRCGAVGAGERLVRCAGCGSHWHEDCAVLLGQCVAPGCPASALAAYGRAPGAVAPRSTDLEPYPPADLAGDRVGFLLPETELAVDEPVEAHELNPLIKEQVVFMAGLGLPVLLLQLLFLAPPVGVVAIMASLWGLARYMAGEPRLRLVMDNREGKLRWYRDDGSGAAAPVAEAAFREVLGVERVDHLVKVGKNRTQTRSQLVARLGPGRTLPLSLEMKEERVLERLGRGLAYHLGVNPPWPGGGPPALHFLEPLRIDLVEAAGGRALRVLAAVQVDGMERSRLTLEVRLRGRDGRYLAAAAPAHRGPAGELLATTTTAPIRNPFARFPGLAVELPLAAMVAAEVAGGLEGRVEVLAYLGRDPAGTAWGRVELAVEPGECGAALPAPEAESPGPGAAPGAGAPPAAGETEPERLPALVPAAPVALVDPAGNPLDLAAPHTVVDLDFGLEKDLPWVALLAAGAGVLLAIGSEDPKNAAHAAAMLLSAKILAGVTVAAIWARLRTRNVYELDNRARLIRERRETLGFEATRVVGRFEEVARVEVPREPDEAAASYVQLRLGSGEAVRVFDPVADRRKALGFGEALAGHLGTELDDRVEGAGARRRVEIQDVRVEPGLVGTRQGLVLRVPVRVEGLVGERITLEARILRPDGSPQAAALAAYRGEDGGIQVRYRSVPVVNQYARFPDLWLFLPHEAFPPGAQEGAELVAAVRAEAGPGASTARRLPLRTAAGVSAGRVPAAPVDPGTCPVCGEGIAGAEAPCPGCRAGYHPGCLAALGGCVQPGCAGGRADPAGGGI